MPREEDQLLARFRLTPADASGESDHPHITSRATATPRKDSPARRLAAPLLGRLSSTPTAPARGCALPRTRSRGRMRRRDRLRPESAHRVQPSESSTVRRPPLLASSESDLTGERSRLGANGRWLVPRAAGYPRRASFASHVCYRSCWIAFHTHRFTWPLLRFMCPLHRFRSPPMTSAKVAVCWSFVTQTGDGGENANSGLGDALPDTPCSLKLRC